MQEIQKYSVFLQALSGKRSDSAGGSPESVHLLGKGVLLWTQLIDKVMGLISGNKKCVHVAMESIDSHLASAGDTLISMIIKNRKEVRRIADTLESLSQENMGKVPEGIQDILSYSFPPAFESEMSSEAFDDIVSKKASKYLDSMECRRMDFQKALQSAYSEKGLESEKDHFQIVAQSWKKGLNDNSSFGEIIDGSKIIMATIPPKILKPFCVSVCQETFQHCDIV